MTNYSTKPMKHPVSKLVMLFFLLALCLPLAASAFSVEKGNTVYLDKGRTVAGNYYAAGSSIVIDGHVTGDVLCAGQSISVNGPVDGDVLCAGQNIAINGPVGGNVRVAGNSIRVGSQIARNLNAFGASVDIAKNAKIGWDALVAGASVQVSGEIGRSLLGAGANFFLNNKIGGDAKLYLDSNQKSQGSLLTISDSAVINGKLEYTSRSDAAISDKAVIKGETKRLEPKAMGSGKPDKRMSGAGYLGFSFVSLLSALALGYALILLSKKTVLEITDKMPEKFWPYLGWGLVWLIVVPIASLILAITIVGFRIAALAMLAYAIVCMLAKIISAIAIGRWIVKQYWPAQIGSIGWTVAIGVVLSWIVFTIPFLGWLAAMAAMWWGTGALLFYLKEMRHA